MPTTTILSTVTKKEITKSILYSEAEIKAIVAKKENVTVDKVTVGSDGVSVTFTAIVTELKENVG